MQIVGRNEKAEPIFSARALKDINANDASNRLAGHFWRATRLILASAEAQGRAVELDSAAYRSFARSDHPERVAG